MNVSYLIQLLNNKLVVLNNAHTQATMNGDLDTINSIETQILDVQGTISKLQLLLTIENAATSANTTPSNVVASGIQAVQNNTGNSSTQLNILDTASILQGYDLSTYATDPLYLQKITDILNSMVTFNNADDVDAYIKGYAPTTPLSGQMIMDAVTQFSVNQYLLIAILELESGFGTQGVGATTFNPGNVGNVDSGATQTFVSWNVGVNAVAEWLSSHRVVV